MASYQYNAAKGTARIHFRYGGKQLNRVEKVENEREAQRLVAVAEDTILDLERGKRIIPPDVDVKAFILTGGKVEKTTTTPLPNIPAAATATIGSIFDTYAETLTPGSKESNSIITEAIHGRHFRRVLGANTKFDGLAIDALQRYVDKRAKDGVVRATIKKELSTLRVVWGWAFKRKHVAAGPAWKMSDLTLPKAHEKPPFQTWDQITRKIERGGLTADQKSALWESLWLDQAQTVDCLAWAKDHSRHGFVYPMFAFAAYTGARRGEMIRSERDDWDFDGGVVTIRQTKADKSKSFTRRSAPIHPQLADIMQAWFKKHPGGNWTLCMSDGRAVIPQTASEFLREALDGGKWRVLRGWHTFRHSLASNMASAGVDQRVINEILGHHTEEMERRYRHLLPRKQEHALNALFRDQAPASC